MDRRLWSEEEYIIVLYLYRFGCEELGVSYTKLGEIMKRSPSSIMMRLANYLSAENEDAGLSGGGKKAREIYHRYKDTPKDDFKKMVIDFLDNSMWVKEAY